MTPATAPATADAVASARALPIADVEHRFWTSTGSFRLIGHDWGGLVGNQLALRFPERIERYIARTR